MQDLIWLDRYSLNAGRTLQPADDRLSPCPLTGWVRPAQQPLKIIDRAGVNINPLNPVDRLDYLRLFSYTDGQCDRLDRIKQIAPSNHNG